MAPTFYPTQKLHSAAVCRGVFDSMADEHENTLDELVTGSVEEVKQLSSGFWRKEGDRGFRRGFRINTVHHAAFCRACEAAGVGFPETGTCGGYPVAVQTHLASCRHISQAERKEAAAALAELKTKRASKGKRTADSPPLGQPSSKQSISSKQSSSSNKFITVPLKDTPLSPEDQRKADKLLVEVTMSANFPLQWVDNPKVRELLALLRPEYEVPSRKKLSGPMLSEVFHDVEADKRAALASAEGAACSKFLKFRRIKQRYLKLLSVSLERTLASI